MTGLIVAVAFGCDSTVVVGVTVAVGKGVAEAEDGCDTAVPVLSGIAITSLSLLFWLSSSTGGGLVPLSRLRPSSPDLLASDPLSSDGRVSFWPLFSAVDSFSVLCSLS